MTTNIEVNPNSAPEADKPAKKPAAKKPAAKKSAAKKPAAKKYAEVNAASAEEIVRAAYLKFLQEFPTLLQLQLALVGIVDGALEEVALKFGWAPARVQEVATLALGLSQKACFFCEAPTSSATVPTDAAGWRQHRLCACLDQFRRGYRCLVPWQTREDQLAVMRRVDAWLATRDPSGLHPDAVVYSDDCSDCRENFTITAKLVTSRARQGLPVHRMHRCQSCAQKRKAAQTPAKSPQRPAQHDRRDRPLTAPLAEVARTHGGVAAAADAERKAQEEFARRQSTVEDNVEARVARLNRVLEG